MIKYFNRKTSEYEIEKVAGGRYLKWAYESPVGKSFLELFIKRKIFSKITGAYCDSKISKLRVMKFIYKFKIDMTSSKNSLHQFKSFNDFFSRKLKPESRPVINDDNVLISPCDGKVLAFENIKLNKVFNVKGFDYPLPELLGSKEIAKKYGGGTCLIIRLCPTDYHRFHFVDSGYCDDVKKVTGSYYSVNPIALQKMPDVFLKNKREWSIFHSNNFGDILYLEVGASCVGTIVQTYTPDENVERGLEKGYFKFGGSTVILFFKKGNVKIDDDILEQSKKDFETKVLMGERIGVKL